MNTGIPVIETYGMTRRPAGFTAHPLNLPRRPGSVGQPVGVELRIVRQAEPVGSRRGGSGVPHRPRRDPRPLGRRAVRRQRSPGDCFHPDGWLRTGDLGHHDEDGFVYLDARTDDVINRGGEKVLPHREVEEIVGRRIRWWRSVAVVGRDDPELGQVPVAYVVLRRSGRDG